MVFKNLIAIGLRLLDNSLTIRRWARLYQVVRHTTMGCILSSEKSEDLSPTSAGGDEVYVYVPGFRTPKYVDLKGVLQGSVSADLASRLHLLRSQVLIASAQNTPASKSKRKKLHQGQPQTMYHQSFIAFPHHGHTVKQDLWDNSHMCVAGSLILCRHETENTMWYPVKLLWIFTSLAFTLNVRFDVLLCCWSYSWPSFLIFLLQLERLDIAEPIRWTMFFVLGLNEESN